MENICRKAQVWLGIVAVVIVAIGFLPTSTSAFLVGGNCAAGQPCFGDSSGLCVDDGSGTCSTMRHNCDGIGGGNGLCAILHANGCGPNLGCAAAASCVCPGGSYSQ